MKKEAKQSFTNKLKDLRMDKGLSRFDVGRQIGRSEDCIEDIENGKREATLIEAARLAKIYNKTLDNIYVANIRKSEL